MTSCLQILQRLTIICLICPAAPLTHAPPLPAAPGETNLLATYLVQEQ
jgi:hypothetical protein